MAKSTAAMGVKRPVEKEKKKTVKSDKPEPERKEKPAVKQKDPMKLKPLKLNVGCGEMYLEGFVNIDLHNPKADITANVISLPMFADNTVDEIYSSHVIEHFHFHDGLLAMKEWHRILRPGGKLYIEAPELLGICRKFLNEPPENHIELYYQLFGQPWFPGQTHLFGYTENQMRWSLESIGFKNLRRMAAMRFTNLVDVCQLWEAEK